METQPPFKRGETPVELRIVAGAVVATAAAFAAAALVSTTGARLTLICAVLGAYAWLVPDVWTALATAGIAFLFLDGFLVNRYGDLSWGGRVSLAQVALLALTTLPALARGRIDAARQNRTPAVVPADLDRVHESPVDQPDRTGRQNRRQKRPTSPKETRG